MSVAPVACALVVLAASARAAAAQVVFGVQAIPILTRAAPAPGDSALAELSLSAPLAFVSASLAGGRVRLHAMLDGEGYTMRDGQLTLGAWGEGYFDRRHPHTLFHELVAWARDPVALPADLHWSLAVGKGFPPFGSDDPMNRPALMYPVNHHWAQVLERAVAIAGLSRGIVTLEAGLFNGDEPERFAEWPKWSRFGDSWSARTLVRPLAALEVQASYARVKSPEDRAGAGPVNKKVSVSGRLEGPLGAGTFYGLAEWTSNSESNGFFVFHSAVVEAQWQRAALRPYVRVERADRPEDQRVPGDPFRSPRPPTDNSLIGISRWTTATAGFGFALPRPSRDVRTEAIGEIGWAHVTGAEGVFDPVSHYGRNDLVMVSVALRIGAGSLMHRMGRYGVTAGEHAMAHPMDGMPGMHQE